MPRPSHYGSIPADEDSIESARELKEQLNLTWSQFLDESVTAIERIDVQPTD
jgi:hypothetical protein